MINQDLEFSKCIKHWVFLPQSFWRVNRISCWILYSPFGSIYAEKFYSRGVDYATFIELTDTSLQQIGVKSRLHRFYFMQIIDQIKNTQPTNPKETRKNSAPMWTKENTQDWLDSLPFGWNFINRFSDLEIDGKLLVRLNDCVLEALIGVKDRVLRRRYMLAINNLSKTGNWNHLPNLEYDVESEENNNVLGFFSSSYAISRNFRLDSKRRQVPSSFDNNEAFFPYNNKQIHLAMFSYKDSSSRKKISNTMEVRDVILWLIKLGYDQRTTSTFEKFQISGLELFELDEEFIKEDLGLKEEAVCFKLLCDINFLRLKTEKLFSVANLKTLYQKRFYQTAAEEKEDFVEEKRAKLENIRKQKREIFEKLGALEFKKRPLGLVSMDKLLNASNENEQNIVEHSGGRDVEKQMADGKNEISSKVEKNENEKNEGENKGNSLKVKANTKSPSSKGFYYSQPRSPSVKIVASKGSETPNFKRTRKVVPSHSSDSGDEKTPDQWSEAEVREWAKTHPVARLYPECFESVSGKELLKKNKASLMSKHGLSEEEGSEVNEELNKLRSSSKIYTDSPHFGFDEEKNKHFQSSFGEPDSKFVDPFEEKISSLPKDARQTPLHNVHSVYLGSPYYNLPRNSLGHNVYRPQRRTAATGKTRTFGSPASFVPSGRSPGMTYPGKRGFAGLVPAVSLHKTPKMMPQTLERELVFQPGVLNFSTAPRKDVNFPNRVLGQPPPPPPKEERPPFNVGKWTARNVESYLKNITALRTYVTDLKGLNGRRLFDLKFEHFKVLCSDNPNAKSIEKDFLTLKSVLGSLDFRDLSNTSVETWTPSNVRSWFEIDTSFPKYGQLFYEKNINGKILVQLTHEMLIVDLGISHGEREEILVSIQRLITEAKPYIPIEKLSIANVHNSVPISLWDKREILSWLNSFRFGYLYFDNFTSRIHSGKQLIDISNEKLRETLLIPIAKHRDELISSLNSYKAYVKPTNLQMAGSFSSGDYMSMYPQDLFGSSLCAYEENSFTRESVHDPGVDESGDKNVYAGADSDLAGFYTLEQTGTKGREPECKEAKNRDQKISETEEKK